MTAIRPMLFGLAMAAIAAFGTDFLLNKRAQASRRSDAPTAIPAPLPTPPRTVAEPDTAAVATPPAESTPPRPALDLKAGERAMSLPLKEGALDSLLRAGSLIDVLGTIDFQGQDGRRSTATTVVAERARVLAVHDPATSRTTRRPSITVAVGYQAAGAIELAATKGSIAVVMRAEGEPTAPRATQVHLHDLITDPAAKPDAAAPAAAEPAAEPAPARNPEWRVRVIRGALTTQEGYGNE